MSTVAYKEFGIRAKAYKRQDGAGWKPSVLLFQRESGGEALLVSHFPIAPETALPSKATAIAYALAKARQFIDLSC